MPEGKFWGDICRSAGRFSLLYWARLRRVVEELVFMWNSGRVAYQWDKFMTEVKTGKSAVDKIGSRGTMHAAGGGSGQGFSAADNRRIDFQK